MKKILAIVLMLSMVFTLAACGGGSSPASESTGSTSAGGDTSSTGGSGESFKVVLVTTVGGLGDQSFNDSAWAGVEKAEAELGVEISLIEPESTADYSSAIVSAVNSGANMVLGFGSAFNDSFIEQVPKFPEVYFGSLNTFSVPAADNYVMGTTADHQGSFLAGALAAMMSESGKIGAVGGQDNVNINRFIKGYEEGAKYINEDIEVVRAYVGAFDDPAGGKEFATQLYNEGADVVFQVASGSGLGVFEAAVEMDKYAIGVDANQDGIQPGYILSSMVKNCDVVAYDIIKSMVDGAFEPGVITFDVSSGGVGLTDFEHTKDIIGEENIATLEEIEKKIASGEIVVTDLLLEE